MIKLYQYPSGWDVPNLSPFCMKVETYLRMTGLSYEIIYETDPRKSPKGKLPFIEDNGRQISDSSLIVEYLKRQYGDVLDDKLTPAQTALSLALQRLLEDHLYWAMLYSRWVEPAGWEIIKAAFFGHMPADIQIASADIARKKIQTDLAAHGLGRNTAEEIYQMGQKNLYAVATILSHQEFMLGKKPSSIDACAYSFMVNLLKPPINTPLKCYAQSQQNLINYCDRMHERYYA